MWSNLDIKTKKSFFLPLQNPRKHTAMQAEQFVPCSCGVDAGTLGGFERAILNSAGAGIIATRTNGIITHFNPEAERMLGYAAEEMIGTVTPEAFHLASEMLARAREFSLEEGIEVPPGFEVFVRAARTGVTETREWTYRRKDGSHLPVLLSVSAIRGHGGEIEGFLGIARDITELKAAQAALRQSEGMLNRAQALAKIGSWEFDLKTSELMLSRELHRILGLPELSPAELGMAYRSRIHPEDLQELDRIVEVAIARREGFTYRYRIPGPDNTLRQIVGIGEVVTDEHRNPVMLRGTVQDVSHQQQTEQRLAEALAAAENANRAKTEFLSRMSHELRTPLNAIIGFARMLTNLGDADALRRTEYLGHINNAGVHLLSLINEILDLGAVESGHIQYNISEFSTARILPEVSSYITPMLAQKKIQLDIEQSSYMVRADYFRLKQVLLNLISNAVKYNVTGGVILVSCQVASLTSVRILVTDTGTGIPATRAASLFTPFERLGADESIEGTGIGLTIAKKLIEDMDGNIGFYNNLGKGTTFWIELPAGMQEPEHAEFRPARGKTSDIIPRKSEETARILLVEDNPVNVALLEAFFARENQYRLDVCVTGIGALAKLADSYYNLVLLDINLPDISGIEVLRHIRSAENTRNIPVIAVSADAMAHQIQAALGAGFDEYLTKPVDFDLLRASMNRLLRRNDAVIG